MNRPLFDDNIPEPSLKSKYISSDNESSQPTEDGSPIPHNPLPVPDHPRDSSKSCFQVRTHFIEEECEEFLERKNKAKEKSMDLAIGELGKKEFVDLINTCLSDTEQVMMKNLDVANNQPTFNYYEFQAALCNKFHEELYTALEETLTTGKTQVRVEDLTKATAKEEFFETYGPIDKEKVAGKKFLNAFLEAKKERAKEFRRQLEFLKKVEKKFGINVVLKSLHYQKQELVKKLSPYFMEKGTEKGDIYDMNPVTSKWHMDWFRLPRIKLNRPPLPPRCEYFLRHKELEGLGMMEYDNPENIHFIDGLWLALVDCGMSEPYSISDDPVTSPPHQLHTHGPKVIYNNQYQPRYTIWKPLEAQMNQEITKYPLGIELNRFFNILKQNYHYTDTAKLFENVSYEDAVTSLPDIFHVAELAGKGKILFPGLIRGIITSPEEIIHKVWKRITFLVHLIGGKMRLQDVEVMYQDNFKLPINMRHWGFSSYQEFIEYCKKQWDAVDGDHVQIVKMERCVNTFVLVYT